MAPEAWIATVSTMCVFSLFQLYWVGISVLSFCCWKKNKIKAARIACSLHRACILAWKSGCDHLFKRPLGDTDGLQHLRGMAGRYFSNCRGYQGLYTHMFGSQRRISLSGVNVLVMEIISPINETYRVKILFRPTVFISVCGESWLCCCQYHCLPPTPCSLPRALNIRLHPYCCLIW